MLQRQTAPAKSSSEQARRARQHLADSAYFLREAIAQLSLLPTSPRNESLGEKAREIEQAISTLERRV